MSAQKPHDHPNQGINIVQQSSKSFCNKSPMETMNRTYFYIIYEKHIANIILTGFRHIVPIHSPLYPQNKSTILLDSIREKQL